MGFTLTGPSVSSLLFGIKIVGLRNNVEVRNGTVSGWYTGVATESQTGNGHRVIGIRAVGNTYGVSLYATGTGHLIQDCTAIQGSFGNGCGLIIDSSGTIPNCMVMNFVDNRGIYNEGGTVSGNVVLNCTGTQARGIRTFGSTTISHNSVINCTTGISNDGGGSIIGNAVKANTGQTGIAPATYVDPNPPNTARPSLLDQNSVNGDGTHYGPGNSATVKGLNSP
jgi:hypothetical protein